MTFLSKPNFPMNFEAWTYVHLCTNVYIRHMKESSIMHNKHISSDKNDSQSVQILREMKTLDDSKVHLYSSFTSANAHINRP
jgi:hypothetical protein